MLHGTYTGPHPALKGEGALLKRVNGNWHAQFDRVVGWMHGWSWFADADFRVDDAMRHVCENCQGEGVLGAYTCQPCGGTGLGRDFLLKGEEEGAASNEEQMRRALEEKNTADALLQAGYTARADGKYENKWFTASILSERDHDLTPPQRKVEYVKK